MVRRKPLIYDISSLLFVCIPHHTVSIELFDAYQLVLFQTHFVSHINLSICLNYRLAYCDLRVSSRFFIGQHSDTEIHILTTNLFIENKGKELNFDRLAS